MPGSKTHLLILNDDPNGLEVVINSFRGKPFHTVFASDIKAVYESLMLNPPDILLLDWAMLVADGFGILFRLQHLQKAGEIKVLIAFDRMIPVQRVWEVFDSGVVDFIGKPFNAVELISKVNNALAQSRIQQELISQRDSVKRLLEERDACWRREMDHKNRELSVQALYAEEKDKLLIDIKEQVKRLRKLVNPEESQRLNRLLKDVKASLERKNDTRDFLFHYRNVDPQFFHDIQTLCNTPLTPNELKLCAYLKMGMNNQEIANLSGVALSSVKSNLNRLKKKLDMAPQDKLRYVVSGLG